MTATGGAFLSSCHVKVLPESKAVPAAWKDSADSNHGSSDQHGADGDLREEPQFPKGNASPTLGDHSCFYDFECIGVKDLPDRNSAKEESAAQSKQKSHAINVGVRVHGHVNG